MNFNAAGEPHFCKSCGVEETPDTFYPRYGGRKFPYCRACAKVRATEWYRKNKAKHKRAVRQHSLRRLYGISHAEYDEMLKAQNWSCAVCLCEPWEAVQGTLSVDHDHKTGAIRGLLCDRCNRALGLLKDSPDNIARLLAYIERHHAA